MRFFLLHSYYCIEKDTSCILIVNNIINEFTNSKIDTHIDIIMIADIESKKRSDMIGNDGFAHFCLTEWAAVQLGAITIKHEFLYSIIDFGIVQKNFNVFERQRFLLVDILRDFLCVSFFKGLQEFVR